MNTSGEAADQVVRMSLEVGEAALKISGAGAKQLAVLLYAILKEQKKTRGRARMETLVRSGKPLTVFTVKERDMKKFVQEAKRYGVLYCAVRDPRGSSDGMVDIMVKEEDASRINHIVERFKFASVTEAAQIKTEIQKSREEKAKSDTKGVAKPDTKEVQAGKNTEKSKSVPEKDREGKSQADMLVNELLGNPVKKEEAQPKNPSLAKTENSRLSEPISGRQNKTAEGISNVYKPSPPNKPSVRKEIKEIQAARRQEARKQGRDTQVKNMPGKSQKPLPHKQPSHKKTKKQSKVR
ncbi:MAG: PcfB family protein [Lachnospiraceae bacterium]|nr:PcfB family protein [Lachnospiraceae bacterium]